MKCEHNLIDPEFTMCDLIDELIYIIKIYYEVYPLIMWSITIILCFILVYFVNYFTLRNFR
jgi:hypothetical protein